MNIKLLAATGQDPIDSTMQKFNGYDVVGVVNSRDELIDKIEKFKPEIVVIGEGLYGKDSLFKYMMKITKDYPELRIVYLAGHVDLRVEHQANNLVLLVMAGIYDIFHEKKMTAKMLKELLDSPRTERDMEYLTSISESSHSRRGTDSMMDFLVPEEFTDEDDSGVLQNVFTFSSIKPGTGKSFISVNIAAAIAEFGENKEDGSKPRVALLEADLQNLSVGTLLGLEDNKKNLKTVMNNIAEIISPEGKIIGTRGQMEKVNNSITSSMLQYKHVRNLDALVGSQLSFSEISSIKEVYYAYLIEVLADNYDVVIVDTNSSIVHVTTLPLMLAAKTCYYVLNLDYNNIKNNIRYRENLEEYGVMHKVEYVLNQDVLEEDAKKQGLLFTSEYLKESAGFDLVAQIPDLPASVFLNRVYTGIPLVLDAKSDTLGARQEILKLANQIYPIKDIDKILKTKAK